jgi:uncharacterized protein YbjQ (UPF0145 family)
LSDNKKDLTRIEDLGEYLHELHEEEEEIPDFPAENTIENSEEDSPFKSSFESSFDSSDDSPFDSSFETSFTSEDDQEEDEEETSANFLSESEESSNFETNIDFSDTPFEQEDTFTLSETLDEEPESLEDMTPMPGPILSPLFEAPANEFKSPENFEDLKKFAESTSFTGMSAEGNPSFSVLIRNVQFIEDVNDIIALMRELKLINDTEEELKSRLMRGTLLVPRISEYAAIYLAHKLRRFDIDIQVGLSDEIHPPKHKEAPEVGMVSKFNLYQNQSHHFHFDDPKLDISHIIVAATPGLEGHQVVRYQGVASEHKMIESYLVEDENSEEIPRYYQELAQKLKAHALRAHANAVVGLNYQLTPLPSEFGSSSAKYRLTCTGNLVWVNKL